MPPSPESLLTLSPPVLRSLLTTFAPRGLPGLRASATPREITRHIFTHAAACPAKLTAFLTSPFPRFGTRAGRAAFAEAAYATNDPDRAGTILSTPAADVAALLAIQLATTTKPSVRRALRRLFALAAQRVERDLPERPTYELVVESPASAPPDAAAITKLLTRAFKSRLDEAWPATDRDGTVRVALLFDQPTENRLVKGAPAPRRDVPQAVDVVRISPLPDGRSRVFITTALRERLPAYARALSLSLRPSFTLRPLHDLTRERLVALSVPGVTRIDVIALRYRRPDGARIEVRADDALDPSLHAQRVGYVDRATLRVTLANGARVDAFLQLPYRVEISTHVAADEAAVRAALSALGLFAPGLLPDDARSLAPYVHGEWRWREALPGAGFDALVKSGLLVRALSSYVATEEHRMHGAAYVVRDVPGERDVQYALAEDPSLGARLVGPKDRVAWRLDLGALAAALMKDLGSSRADAPLTVAGVLDLGVVTLPSGKLRVLYAMEESPPAWVEALPRACGLGVTPVVLVPRGHAARAGHATGVLVIEIDVSEQLGVKRVGRVLGRIAEALGVETEVEDWRRCDEEVVIDLAAERLWVTGVSVSLPVRSWRYVEYLAKQGGKVATTKEIGLYLSRSDYPDVSARKTRVALERQVRVALEAAGADAGIAGRMIASEGRVGIRFGVGVRVVGAKAGAKAEAFQATV